MDDINQSVKDLNRDAEDGQIDDELSSNPKRVGDRGEAILAQLILRVNDKSNDAEPEMEKPTIQQQIANLEKEIETDPTPMKIQRLQRLKSQAGGGAFGNMEEGMSLGDRRRAASKQIGDKIKQMDHYINMQPSLVDLQDIQDMIPMDLRMDVEDVSNILMNHSEYDSVVDFLDFVMRRR